MISMFNDKHVGLRGPKGSDGNSIGTIISFMGTVAPKDYLVCDGKEYSITDYPELAQFFKIQFGSSNYFGGNDSMFAVPDLRNLFLRGYHGDADKQLSGEIGEKQEATLIPHVSGNSSGAAVNFYINQAKSGNIDDPDTIIPVRTGFYSNKSSSWTQTDGSPDLPGAYTSRPVNMAVLFCIKAADSNKSSYCIEETEIGRWIDNKQIYQSIFNFVCPDQVGVFRPVDLSSFNIETLINFHGCIQSTDGTGKWPINSISGLGDDIITGWIGSNDLLSFNVQNQYALGCPGFVILEYTKTIDS